MEVAFAHEVDTVARVSELARQRMGEIVWNRNASRPHAEDAGMPLVLPGPEDGSGRQTGGNGRVGAAKKRAPGGKIIEKGRFDDRMAGRAEAVARI